MTTHRHGSRRGGSRRAGGRSTGSPATARYPRVARVNRLLLEVVAEELERLSDGDERLRLLTVTAVDAEPGLRHATVLLASLEEPAEEALAEARVRLQGAIARQVRLKRTPALVFAPDPAIAEGQHIEAILAAMARRRPPQPDCPPVPDGPPGPEPPPP